MQIFTLSFAIMCRYVVQCFYHTHYIIYGRGWQYHFKYIEQNSYKYLLSVHSTNRCRVTSIALWQAFKFTAVSWHLIVFCILRKELKQSCHLNLIWHFQRPFFYSQRSPISVVMISTISQNCRSPDFIKSNRSIKKSGEAL